MYRMLPESCLAYIPPYSTSHAKPLICWSTCGVPILRTKHHTRSRAQQSTICHICMYNRRFVRILHKVYVHVHAYVRVQSVKYAPSHTYVLYCLPGLSRLLMLNMKYRPMRGYKCRLLKVGISSYIRVIRSIVQLQPNPILQYWTDVSP